MQSALGAGGCSLEIFSSATCSLQFAKASAATLPQKGKEKLAKCAAGQSKYIRLYRYSANLVLAATYL